MSQKLINLPQTIVLAYTSFFSALTIIYLSSSTIGQKDFWEKINVVALLILALFIFYFIISFISLVRRVELRKHYFTSLALLYLCQIVAFRVEPIVFGFGFGPELGIFIENYDQSWHMSFYRTLLQSEFFVCIDCKTTSTLWKINFIPVLIFILIIYSKFKAPPSAQNI